MSMRKINPIVEEQLGKCRVTDISHLDTTDYTLFIPKVTTIKLEVNQVFIIKIDESVQEPSMFNTNWNKGIPPICSYMQVDVTNILNTAVRINGIEYDPETKTVGKRVWSGWIPFQSIEVLSKL